MKKCFKRAVSSVLAAAMLFSSMAFAPMTASAAGFTTVGGWNESLYAEWADSNPDSTAVKVGYKLSSDSSYTYLAGDDLTYLVRKASTSGLGRVDIPGLKAGRYDLEVTSSNGTVNTRTGIRVYANDRSGYAHWQNTEGIGGYKNDGTPRDNAIVVYVTDENKDTVEIPGYEGKTWSYTPSTGSPYTRTGAGIGNILNNNMKLIQEVTITDNHPLIIRFVGKVNVPANLTPKGTKDPILGGGDKDNGNLAITKYGRNITLEGVGEDAVIEAWGFTFSQTGTCPAEAGKSFEVSNLTFEKYPEDALGFQGEDGITSPIERVWVHNNTFYPGYCANPIESDKKEGDGSCDFKRGQYYTMAYNHYINCHKTNLLGSGTSDKQWNMTLHHNWYENVGSRQPLAANGNIHIYNTYFDGATSTTVDLRGSNDVLLESNYYNNCKNYFGSRNNTCIAKSYNEKIVGGTLDSVSGTRTVVSSRDTQALKDCGFKFPDGTAMTNFDLNPAAFYYDSANKVSDVEVMTPVDEVPAYVMAHAGTMQPIAETESGEIRITVKSGNTAITGAKVTAPGLSFSEQGNGVYVATASLGATYTVTVSKEGYSNVVINTTALANDGDVFTGTANLVVDTDGYAVVQLQGGSEGAPVTGATVKLNNGTTLVEQGNGIYKSANQIAVGTYTATITNTGDFIAPTSAVNVVVKTTDEETVISLDKYTGTVNVTVTPASGETNVPDLTKATVTVGNTVLTNNNGTFTGSVEVGTPYAVTVKVPGWATDSVTPATLTANRTSAVSAAAVISYKGDVLIWNHTDNTNTLNATVTGNDWSSASSNPQTFEDKTLTKALKMESSTSIKFNADTEGTLTVVMYSTNDSPTVLIDGTAYNVNASGATEIPVTAGAHEIKKGTSSTYIYYAQFAPGGSSTPSTPTTEATTEATTKAQGSDATTEATTSAPVPSGSKTHNFSTDGKTSTFYTIAGDNLAAKGDITYNGLTLSQSLKLNSNGSVTFTTTAPGKVTLVFGNSAGKKVLVDDTEYSIANATEIITQDLAAGTHTIKRSSGESFLYYISYADDGAVVGPTESTSESTSEATTVATTETTTVTTTETTTVTTTVTTTEATTEATTAATTEATTQEQPPVSGVKVSVGSASAKTNEQIVIPVKLTGVSSLASYDVNIAFDAANITVNSVTAGDMITDSNALMSYTIGNGTLGVTGANPVDTIASGKDVLFNIVATPKKAGTYTLTVTVDEIYVGENQTATATVENGVVTVEDEIVGPTIIKGDADNNGKVELADVKHILNFVTSVIEKVNNSEAADVNADNKVSSRDAYIIQKYLKTGKW